MWPDSTAKSIEIVLAAPATTNQISWSVAFSENASNNGTSAPQSANGVTSDTTPVTVIAAPASDFVRLLLHFVAFNLDTVATVVTVQFDDGSATPPLASVTLQVGEALYYEVAAGWYVLTTDGARKGTGPTGATGAAGTNGTDGTDGTDGVGVPAGGSSGDVLEKASGTDYDTLWVTPSLAGGWTGSDLSATGPGVVVQASTGAVLTVDAYLGAAFGGTDTDSSAATGIVHVDEGAWTFSPVDLTTDVTGILPLANGGTDADLSATGPGVVIQATTGDALTVETYLDPTLGGIGFDPTGGEDGNVLTWNGSAFELDAPAGASNHDLLDGSVDQDTNAAAVVAGSLVYGNDTPLWDALAVGSEGYVLTVTSGLPAWTECLGLASGGTDADFSASGPGVVVQATTGAALTVATYLAPSMGGLGIDLSGASEGDVPTADGMGGFTLEAGGGGGTPGGSDTYVQYNDSGAFAGDGNFVWDYTNQSLTINGLPSSSTAAINVSVSGGTGAVALRASYAGFIATLGVQRGGVGAVDSDNAASFTDGTRTLSICGGSTAIIASDGVSISVEICDGTNAINANSGVFVVDPTGNLTIASVAYVWPTSNAVGQLTNDGSGNLSWAFAAANAGGTGIDSSSTTGVAIVTAGVWSAFQSTTSGIGSSGFTANTGANPVDADSTFDGGLGGTAYTISDLVLAMKGAGLLAA